MSGLIGYHSPTKKYYLLILISYKRVTTTVLVVCITVHFVYARVAGMKNSYFVIDGFFYL